MTNETLAPARALDWLRVGALSGSFAAHAVILLLAALPMTVPSTRPIAKEIVARWIETPPPEILPEPPPPEPPPRHAPRATPASASPTPVPAAAAAPAPIDDATVPTVPMASSSSSVPDIDTGGATQALAYASPMRPRYPPASVRAREQGIVTLRVLVDASGSPQRVEIARSSGHARLDAAAKESVERARFRPVVQDGVAISAWGIVPIAFRLDRG
ncbi:MAG TPA: energy transducer TonB [Rhodanobacteraceae bacterium]|nr:energy transducer TonB [Rhodanobacteraceae bacterium]